MPDNSVLLFFDEKGKTPVKHYEGKKWVENKNDTGENFIYKIPGKQNVRGLVDYFAAKDFHTGKIYYSFYDWKNAFIVVDFFERILREIPDKIIYIVLDCWAAHKKAAKLLAGFHPRLKLIFLPTNASWMNVIEQFFSHVERFVLRNSNFQSVQALMRALSSFVTFGSSI